MAGVLVGEQAGVQTGVQVGVEVIRGQPIPLEVARDQVVLVQELHQDSEGQEEDNLATEDNSTSIVLQSLWIKVYTGTSVAHGLKTYQKGCLQTKKSII